MVDLPRPEDDGLPIMPVSDWARDKHHFLRRYVDAFVTSMRNKRWASLHYVDLFAGAGLARLKKSGALEWGSPIIAAHAPYPFRCLHLCEHNAAWATALQARLRRLAPAQKVQLIAGDANKCIHEIVRRIPQKALTVAFLDPTGLHLEFRTLSVLAARRADLIIFFPDRTDILRNWLAYYYANPESNLDRYFGAGSDWRRVTDETPPNRLCDAFLDFYKQQIASLGYSHFEFERIPVSGAPMYRLIYASRHRLGSTIWRRVSLRKPDRQDTFDFGEP